MYEQSYTYWRHQECTLDNNSITWPTSSDCHCMCIFLCMLTLLKRCGWLNGGRNWLGSHTLPVALQPLGFAKCAWRVTSSVCMCYMCICCVVFDHLDSKTSTSWEGETRSSMKPFVLQVTQIVNALSLLPTSLSPSLPLSSIQAGRRGWTGVLGVQG